MTQQYNFQQFFDSQNLQTQLQVPEYIVYNETIIEIVNNWVFVIDLMKRYREGKLQKLDILEQSWYIFITKNNIDITIFKDEEEFLNTLWKSEQN